MEDKILGEWKIISQTEEGSSGIVYKVKRDDGLECAIKHIILPKSPEEVEKLITAGKITSNQDANQYYYNEILAEVNVLKRFNGNPNVLSFYDFSGDTTPGGYTNYYIRMEYAETVKDHFTINGVSQNDVAKLGIDICSALELCEANGISHNDIKPENIFIGTNGKYKLGDFSNVSQIGSESLITNGTPNYLAPEIYLQQSNTTSTDLYSLGLVMYKLLSGKLPFVSDSVSDSQAFEQRMNGTPIPTIEGINKNLMDIVSKACTFDTSQRYLSATEMKEDLLKVTGLSTKKKYINFFSSLMEKTISVFDTSLLINSGGEPTSRIRKINISKGPLIKKGITVLVILIIGLLFFRNYRLNRSCDAGYINKNGKCVKGYYYCSSGYSLNADNECQKTIESKDAKVTYTCKAGFTLNGDVCVSNDVKEPVFVYKCADGFTLNGMKCEKIETNDAVITYSCPSGYTRVDQACVKGTSINATANYSCTSGYTLTTSNGAYICTKQITSSTNVNATVTYTCKDGSQPNSQNKCARTYYVYNRYMCAGEFSGSGIYGGGMYGGGDCTVYDLAADKVYTCPADTKNNNNGTCTYTGNTTDTKQPTISYSCPTGYTRVGAQCTTAETINGTPVYTCLDSQRREGKKCITVVSTDAVGMYECPEGFIASGVNCIQNEFPQPMKKYSCSRVYTLNGGKCEKYEILPAKAHYND